MGVKRKWFAGDTCVGTRIVKERMSVNALRAYVICAQGRMCIMDGTMVAHHGRRKLLFTR